MSTDQVGCMVFLGPAAVGRGIKEGAESTEKALLLANISIYTTIKQQQNGFCPSKLKTNTINSLVFFSTNNTVGPHQLQIRMRNLNCLFISKQYNC